MKLFEASFKRLLLRDYCAGWPDKAHKCCSELCILLYGCNYKKFLCVVSLVAEAYCAEVARHDQQTGGYRGGYREETMRSTTARVKDNEQV